MYDKLIFVISGKGINHYDLDDIKKSDSMIVVALVNDTYKDIVDEKVFNDFDEVCFVPSSEKNYGLEEVDESETKKIIRKKIDRYKTEQSYIVCANEGNMVVSAKLRTYFNFPGLQENQVYLFRDKCLMKRKLSSCGVKTADFLEFDFDKAQCGKSYYEGLVDVLGSPFVLKPKSSGGGKNVHFIKSYEHLMEVIGRLENIEYDFFVESIISGELYHCDIVVNNGEVIFSECSEYNWSSFDEGSKHPVIASFPLKENTDEKNKIIGFCKNIVSILGSVNGTYHIEVFEVEGELVFLELGLRMPGTLIPKMYESMYGVNLWNVDLAIQCDFFKGDIPLSNRYALWAYFLEYENGRVLKVESLHSEIDECIDWNYSAGDVISGNPALTGSLVFSHKDRNKVLSVFNCFKGKSPLILDQEVS